MGCFHVAPNGSYLHGAKLGCALCTLPERILAASLAVVTAGYLWGVCTLGRFPQFLTLVLITRGVM